MIRRELELHGHGLRDKPEVVAVSKAELTDSVAVRNTIQEALGKEVLAVSAVTGQGLEQLIRAVVAQFTEAPVGAEA